MRRSQANEQGSKLTHTRRKRSDRPEGGEYSSPSRFWIYSLVITLVSFLAAQSAVQAGRIEVIEVEDQSQQDDEPETISITTESEGGRITVESGDGDRSTTYEVDWEDLEDAAEQLSDGFSADYRDGWDHSDQDLVTFGHNVYVDEGEVIDGNVVAVFGSAYIKGTVDGEVIAIGGEIELSPGAVITGQAVAVGGGNVYVPDEAVVHGEVVSVGGRIKDDIGSRIGERIEITFLPEFSGSYGMSGFGWLFFLAHIICIGLIGVVLIRFSRSRWGASVMTLKDRGWESLLAGVGGNIVYTIVLLPLMLVLSIALIAIVVGIPLVPVIGLLLLIFPIPGYLIACALLGYTLNGLPTEDSAGEGDNSAQYKIFNPSGLGRAYLLGHLLLSLPGLAGMAILSFGAPFQVAGVFWILSGTIINLAITLGWGAFLLSRFGRRTPVGVSVL
jgi:hypothetical protein